MSEMKAVYEALLPDGAIWQPKSGGDFDNLLAGIGDNAQVVYEFLDSIASIRDPRKTPILSDLEKEYGQLTNLSLTDAERRNNLLGIKYAKPDTASDKLVQDKLRAAGFTGIIVTSNDPAIDPDLITGELLVNGPIYIEQKPGYLAQANGDNTFAGNALAIAGYFLNIERTAHTYGIPDLWRYWRFMFFVGGAASGWPGAPAIATFDVDYKREEALKTLILKYKPLHSWWVLVVDFIMFWTHQTPDASYSGTFAGAAASSDLFLLTGAPVQLQISPDGIEWTQQTPDGSPTNLNDAIHGDDLFVVVGSSGAIQTSPDGENWDARTADAAYSGNFNGAGFGNGLFVIVGSSGEIQTSPDGIAWTARTADAAYAGTFFSVTYNNGLFVIVGDSGEIQTSPDGITWTHQTPAAAFAGTFAGATFGGLQFCIVGTSGEIQTSFDGITWTHQTPAAAFAGTFAAAIYGNGRFVIVGTTGEIQSSENGSTWKAETADAAYSGAFASATYKAGTFLIGGQTGEIQTD